jgi:hypothetical protein
MMHFVINEEEDVDIGIYWIDTTGIYIEYGIIEEEECLSSSSCAFDHLGYANYYFSGVETTYITVIGQESTQEKSFIIAYNALTIDDSVLFYMVGTLVLLLVFVISYSTALRIVGQHMEERLIAAELKRDKEKNEEEERQPLNYEGT